MATLTDTGRLLMSDVLQRMGPNGEIRPMVEILNKKLDILDDIPWVECDLETGKQIAYRTGLPSAQWRSINEGVSLTKTRSETYIEAPGMMEDRAEVDVDQIGNIAALRMSEERGKVEMLSQEFARALFYESTYDNADRIHGLAPRYGGTSGYTSSGYVGKGTNAGTNCHSIWLLSWSNGNVYGIYPKNSSVGLQRKDLGEVDAESSAGKKFRAYATKLQWKCGIAVEDYRTSMRFQWDPDDANFADSAKGMYLGMQDMLGVVYNQTPEARFYMNRTSFRKLCAQLASNTVNFLEYVAMGGRRIPSFLGVPIRITDALVAETAIS